MNKVRVLGSLIVVGSMVVGSVAASGTRVVPIQERARGATRVVVATVESTSSRYHKNAYGDDLIMTDAQLTVEEALKGAAGGVRFTIEGGTVDGITMHVSDLPAITSGERAVFFLVLGPDGVYQPHLRGQGILKLDRDDRVRNSSLTLGEIRRLVRGEAK